MKNFEHACPFCTPDAGRIFHTGPLTLGVWDMFPVNPGHALLVTRRHVASWFDATPEERADLFTAIDVARREIQRNHAPSGYNVGINIGAPAGQTVFHLHVHVIPRYAGDVEDPRGGVRYVIPAKANYKNLSPNHGAFVMDEESDDAWARSAGETLPQALTEALATLARAANALEQYHLHAGVRTLAFCCSKRHADFMRDFFLREGVRAAAVHSNATSDPRAASLERLKAGEIDIVFAVDMFNEGVDLPEVDTVMMLRPTESRILWLQQFGRGLRRAEGKQHLNVIDYIGNHRTFLIKPQTLFSLPTGDAQIDQLLTLLQRDEADLPPGCNVTYDLKAINILRSLLRLQRNAEAIRLNYEDLRQRFGVRPTASEVYHEGYSPLLVRHQYGSWFGFVQAMGDLSADYEKVVNTAPWADFLSELERTHMTKSYKMLVLRAMLDAKRFPGEINIKELCDGVVHIARRSAAIQKDLSAGLNDERGIRILLEQNPINAWTKGQGTGGVSYFKYDEDMFETSHGIGDPQRQFLIDLVSELVDWRLAQYLDRATPSPP